MLGLIKIIQTHTAWKVSKYQVISGPNTGKYGPEMTLYLDTFNAVLAASIHRCFENNKICDFGLLWWKSK